MNRKLLLLGAISILSVVLSHAIGWGLIGMFGWAHRYSGPDVVYTELGSSLPALLMLGVKQLTFFCVPAFLFISGYFTGYASLTGKGLSWKFVRERIINLLIPYLLWSAVVLVYDAARTEPKPALFYAEALLLGQANIAYYYVPVIIQLYLAARWLVPFTQRNWKKALLVTGGLQAAAVLLNYLPAFDLPAIVPSVLFIKYALYFTMGTALFQNQLKFVEWLSARRTILLAATVASFVLFVVEQEAIYRVTRYDLRASETTLFAMMYNVLFLLTFVAFANRLNVTNKAVNLLGTRTYGIFLAHPLVLDISARGVYHFLPALLGLSLPFILLIFSIGAAVPLLLMQAIQRLPIRSAYRYLFG